MCNEQISYLGILRASFANSFLVHFMKQAKCSVNVIGEGEGGQILSMDLFLASLISCLGLNF